MPLSNTSQAQIDALQLDKHIFVEAGPGSGKTTILIHRFVHILQQNPSLNPDQILAITFTQKAANEMLSRIQELISDPESDLPFHLKERLSSTLHLANISTIHSFCASMLRQNAFSAGINPDFSILEPDHALLLLNQAIDQGIGTLKKLKDPSLIRYLRTYSSPNLKQDLQTLFNKRQTASKWFKHYQTNPDSADYFISDNSTTADKELTLKSFKLLRDLAIIFQACLIEYERLKTACSKLDYDDLLSLTETLFQTHPNLCKRLGKQFSFIMVDEFQDTDSLQWNIIHILSQHTKNLFLVGDIKQSIYSFRGADTCLFKSVMESFLSQPITHNVIRASDNFRSQEDLLNVINPLFKDIFNASLIYTPLTPYKPGTGEHTETIILSNTNNPGIMESSETNEALTMVKWIQNKQKQNPALTYNDFAVLIRKKHNMELYKRVFDQHNIPSFTHTALGFYQNPEVIQMINLAKALLNPTDNLALISVLKSPFFNISDEALFLLYSYFKTSPLLFKLNMFTSDFGSFSNNTKEWLDETKGLQADLINFHAKMTACSADSIDALKHAGRLIPRWLKLKNTTPLYKLLEIILMETKAWQTFAAHVQGDYKIANIKAFIAKMRQVHATHGFNIPDISSLLDAMLASPKDEANPFLRVPENAVQILTIHAAKGLEFPYVLIPECGAQFNFSHSERLLISDKLGIGISIKSHSKAVNLARKQILADLKNQIIEEEKRLFFVACTRAKNALVFIGSKKKTNTEKKRLYPKCYLDFIEK
ncbi:UvrD-helicase domain-containing protein [Thermoproteota archaeon]